MSDFRFELDYEGIGQLLKSDEVKQVCEQRAKSVLDACGDGYEMDSKVGAKRVNVRVKAATPHAYYSNLKHNTLMKALGK